MHYDCWLTEEEREVPLVWVLVLFENNSTSSQVKNIKNESFFFFL